METDDSLVEKKTQEQDREIQMMMKDALGKGEKNEVEVSDKD